ncbi:penicillin-binding protein 1C, partial [Alistipes onderdonkii]
FIYPADGSIISLPRQLDGSPGSFVARVAHTNPATELFWHLDNIYLGSTRDIHQMTIAPIRGVHTITVVDTSGIILCTAAIII